MQDLVRATQEEVFEVLGKGYFFFFKQKTAYEIVDCDWSSDVCSSDLLKRKKEVLQLILLTLNTRQTSVTMHTLTVLVTLRSEERRCRERV